MKRQHLVTILLLFIITVAIRVPVLRSVGETWDEYTVVSPGETYISAIKNLDFSESAWIQNYEHPPLAKYLYGLSRLIPRHLPAVAQWDREYHPDKEYTVPRLLAAIFGGLTVVLVFLIGKKLFSPTVGVVASLILAVMPSFIAYTSIASLEAAFIFFSTLFIYCWLRALASGRGRDHLLAVVTLTLTFATRYNGLFFVFFYAVTMLIKYRTKIPWPVLLSPVIFLGLFYCLWPWLWLSPLSFVDSLLRSTGGHSGEYFLGSLMQPDWYYYLVYFFVTNPEVLIILFLVFLITTFRKMDKKLLFILFWFATPFLATFSAFKQDGIRYVIACTPALALISGYGVVWSFKQLRRLVGKVIFLLLLAVGLLYPVICYFPYYLDYYNVASGGAKQAYVNKSFEVGWWGEGGLAAVRWLNANAGPRAVVRVNFSPRHVLPKFREDLRCEQNFVLNNQDDFILINTYNERYGDPRMMSDLDQFRLVYQVTASLGTPLVKIYKRL